MGDLLHWTAAPLGGTVSGHPTTASTIRNESESPKKLKTSNCKHLLQWINFFRYFCAPQLNCESVMDGTESTFCMKFEIRKNFSWYFLLFRMYLYALLYWLWYSLWCLRSWVPSILALGVQTYWFRYILHTFVLTGTRTGTHFDTWGGTWLGA